uniref:Uncharacterized protein n=1 Tax=Glossina brevipalpis TaxID=37001 RepID=A0A1A9WLS8_9MUSC
MDTPDPINVEIGIDMQSKSSCLSLLAFICFAVITFYSKPAIACSCMPSHPQTLYCEADYGKDIKTCFQRFCSKKDKDRSVCLWSPFDACKKDFSACLPYTSYHGISYYKQQQQQQQDDFSKYHRELRCKWRSSPFDAIV